ncbi:MAG: tetratricopeptide repeat protein [Wenzhouxiangellaceae bacterium]
MQALSAIQNQSLLQAQRLLSGGRLDQASGIARQLVQQAPRSPDALQLLAMCQAQAGQIDEAEQSFRKALRYSSEHPLIMSNYAQMLRRAGRAEEALTLLQKATEKAPEFAPAWLGLGRAARACERNELAESALTRLVRLQPRSAPGWFELGRTLQALERYEAAHEALARAAELAPREPAYVFNLGVCERLLGQPEQALTCYRRAERLGLDKPELGHARVGALLDCGQVHDAVEQTRALIRQHPDFTPAYETMADLLWEHGDEDSPDPENMFQEAIRQRPGDQALRQSLAGFLVRARRHASALEVLEQLRAERDSPALQTLHANALDACGQRDRATDLYRQVHARFGDSNSAFLNAYTRHLLRAGEWKQAEQRALAATRLAPEDQEAWAYLSTAWRLLGDAREDWLCDYENAIVFLEVPTPDSYPDRARWLEALEQTLDRMHQARREPIQQSLRGGSQTSGRLFGRTLESVTATQQSLTSTIERWLAELPKRDDHPFYQRNTGRIRYTGSWSVKLWSSGSHVSHIHPEGWISSAFYVALPPSVSQPARNPDDTAGCIQFGQPPAELGLDLAPRRVIHPRTGHLALFPSYMWHGTFPFEDDQPRMTIAFDMRADQGPTQLPGD